MTHNEKNQSKLKTNQELIQVLELAEKDTKVVIKDVFHILKK